MTTYFGQCNSDGTTKGTSSNNDASFAWWGSYACPGSGAQSITSAAVFGRTSGAVVRMAIYDAAGTTKIAESGTGVLTGSEGWGECTFTGVTLTGGTTYTIACTIDSAGIASDFTGPDTISYATNDYTGGFPSSLPAPGGSGTILYDFRVGVDAGAQTLSGVLSSAGIGALSATGDFTGTGEFIRPDNDSSDGEWTNEADSTTNLYASIDESSINDADYIKSSPSPSNDTTKIALGNPAGTPAEPMFVRYRFWNTRPESGAMSLRVRLLQGSTQIASWTESNVGSTPQTKVRALSGGEFASISDFTDLYLEFRANYLN